MGAGLAVGFVVAVGSLGAGVAVVAGWLVSPLHVSGDQRPTPEVIASV